MTQCDHVHKYIDLVGTSPESIEDAIQNAINKCDESIRNMRWFEVKETHGRITDGKVSLYQVKLSVAFTLEAK